MKSTKLYYVLPLILSACATSPTINKQYALDIYKYENLDESKFQFFYKNLINTNNIKQENGINYTVLSTKSYEAFIEKMATESIYSLYKYKFKSCQVNNGIIIDSMNNNVCSDQQQNIKITPIKTEKDNILFQLQLANNAPVNLNINTDNHYLIYYYKSSPSITNLYIINRNWVNKPWDSYRLSPQSYNKNN